jgi:hypothetical protein
MIVPCIHKTVLQSMDFVRITLPRLAKHSSELGCRVSNDLTPHIPGVIPAQLYTFYSQEWSFWTTLGTPYSGLVKCPSKVSEQKRIWRTVLPIALLVLVIGTTLGGVWHCHAISSPDACPICHLSHQAIEPPLASTRVYILVPTGRGPESQRDNFAPSPAIRRIPVRGPPA